MKLAVVGLGFMGSTHLQAYQNIPNAEVAAIVSADQRKRSGDLSAIQGNLDRPGATMDFGQAARYATIEELLADSTIDAVDLCVPTHLHAPLAVKALDAGKHVLVEKPMALSAQDCDAMIAAAARNKRVLMVAQVLRFWPDYAAAREKILSGELGPVKSAFFRRKCAAPGWGQWLHDREKSGGGVFDLLIHDFDYALHLFGKPQAVSATGVEEIDKGIDLVTAQLHYESGLPVTISGGWHHPQAYPFSMEFTIVSEGGTLDFDSGLRRLTLFSAGGKGAEVAVAETDGFQAELAAFIDACERGEPPARCRPEDSALATKMTLAMRESRERGGAPVEV